MFYIHLINIYLSYISNIIDYVENNTNYSIDKDKRIVYHPKNEYIIHDVNWVINNKQVSSKYCKKYWYATYFGINIFNINDIIISVAMQVHNNIEMI